METDNFFDPVDFVADLMFLALCVGLFVWTSRKDKNSPPAVWGKPLSVRALLFPRKSEGDHLASRKDWWLLNIYIQGFYVAFTLLNIAVGGVGALLYLFIVIPVSLIALVAFAYLGAQRFIAAGYSGFWILAVLVLPIPGVFFNFDTAPYGTVLYVVWYGVSTAPIIFVGVIPNKAETQPKPAH